MPLKIRPGRYLTRDGRVAVVRNCDLDYKYPWNGTVCGTFRCWNKYGKWWSGGDSDFDLIRRLPSKPKRKPEKVHYEVVIRSPVMTTKAKACEIAARAQAVTMISHSCRVTVRRLPPARAKRGG